MILVIDIGNTNIVFGFFEADEVKFEFRIETSAQKKASDYQKDLRVFLLEKQLKVSQFKKIILSSVVPGQTQIVVEMCKHLFGMPPLRVNAELFPRLPLKINNPQQIGTDLVANALAAIELMQVNTIVVDFGTALTFTTVEAGGYIRGVSIAPGLKTAMKALSGNTAQLPEIPLELPASAIGTDTISAIQAGIMVGYTGMVKYMVSEIRRELQDPYHVIATGGLSSILSNLHNDFDYIDKHLTLKGLYFMGKYFPS